MTGNVFYASFGHFYVTSYEDTFMYLTKALNTEIIMVLLSVNLRQNMTKVQIPVKMNFNF